MVIATVRGKVLVCVHASQQHRAQRLPLQSHQSMRARPRVWSRARPRVRPPLSLLRFSFCPKGAQRKGVFGNSSVQVCRTCSREHPVFSSVYRTSPPRPPLRAHHDGGLPNSECPTGTRLCTRVLWMVVRFVGVIRVPLCAPACPECVPCVSRLPPVSFYWC